MADEEYPQRIVTVQGATARAFQRAPKEVLTVKESEDIDKALADPGNTHHCPLCNQFYGATAFQAHAQSCIKANAPRWERQRDKEPGYARITPLKGRLAGVTQLRARVFGATPKTEGR